MPIKFRCNYCRQFLGISRGRAGDVVDCPTCGRSIRVPGLDGMAAPVPTPEMNLRDAKLSRALDELAQWNAPSAVPADASLAEAEVEIPQPISEPIPIEVPVAPEPIAVKPPPSVEPLTVDSATRSQSQPETVEPAFTVAAAIAELAQISAEEPVRRPDHDHPQPENSRRQPPPTRWNTVIAALLLVAAAFAAGYFASHIRRPASEPTNSVEHAAPAAAEPPAAPAITGRITYKTADGESLPDRGSRILILPREREGTAKFSANGFRAADHPADVRLAQAALRSLGGDLALADDGGKFSIQLPNPGTFHILVVSNYASREKNDELDPELLRLLTPYFEQPVQILGRTKVHFGQVRYKGTGTEVWDHSF